MTASRIVGASHLNIVLRSTLWKLPKQLPQSNTSLSYSILTQKVQTTESTILIGKIRPCSILLRKDNYHKGHGFHTRALYSDHGLYN